MLKKLIEKIKGLFSRKNKQLEETEGVNYTEVDRTEVIRTQVRKTKVEIINDVPGEDEVPSEESTDDGNNDDSSDEVQD